MTPPFKLLPLFLALVMSASGATYYVDNSQTVSSNAGTSANPWTNFASIVWSTPAPGDSIILRAPAGLTNTYYESLQDYSGSPQYGTSNNPITIKASQESGHNGLTRIFGGIALSRDYWMVDGSKTTWLPGSVLDTYNVGGNCNIEVYNTNLSSFTQGVNVNGTGCKVKWVHVSKVSNYDDDGITMMSDSSHPIGSGSEIAYCWISSANGFGIRVELSDVVAPTYGQLNIHHNLLEWIGDNFFQIGGFVDVHDNVCRNQHVILDNGFPSYAGHPDCIQEVEIFSRVWNNTFYNTLGSRFYIEANSPLTHDILVYNNLWYSDSTWYTLGYTNAYSGGWLTNVAGTGIDITGHDAGSGTACNLSNVWIFNNTMQLRGGTTFVDWGSGTTENPRLTNSWVTNICMWNNNLVALGQSTPLLSLSTNLDYYNDFNGWTYTDAQVPFDFNSINGAISSGQGISYNRKGSHDPGYPVYTNMADFASDTAYKSNNNGAAVYVNTNTFDYRPMVGDQALVGRGTNLAALLSAIAPYSTNDILGNPRGSVWDIGAYQHPPGYWVALSGNDSTGDGSFLNPWRTIAKSITVAAAGNIVNITPGDYGESVRTDQYVGGTIGNPIRFVSYPPQQAILRSFELRVPYIVLDSLVFSNNSQAGVNGNSVCTEIDQLAHDCIVTNCIYAHPAYVSASDFHFANSGGNQIMSSNSDFNAAGFVTGSYIYLGACGIPGQYYTNHDTQWYVSSVATHTLVVTNGTGDSFLTDTGSNYWAMILSGTGQGDGIIALGFNPNGQLNASNLTFVGNLVRDWMGLGLVLKGDGHVITGNTFTNYLSYSVLSWLGNNTVICSNVFIQNNNVLNFTPAEGALLTHPPGAGWWDFYMAQVTSESDGVNFVTNKNNSAHHNLWIGVDNEFGSIYNNGLPDSYGMIWTNNVFVGIYRSMSFKRNASVWANNVMYKCGYDVNPLIFGSENGIAAETNLVCTNNLFIDCGPKTSDGSWGYSICTVSCGGATNPIIGMNMTAGPETRGYSVRAGFTETNGVNGGDPVFLNPYSPFGADGIPFTADDGFLVLPNSPMAALGGAYGVYQITTNVPVAHFSLLSPSVWVEATGTNFDPAWVAKTPGTRYQLERPWDTIVNIGTNVTAVFDARFSISATNGVTTNLGISQYVWTIDGANLTNTVPFQTNTFTVAGTKAVVLTVYNTAGNSAVTTNYYTVGGTNAAPPPGPPPSGVPRTLLLYL